MIIYFILAFFIIILRILFQGKKHNKEFLFISFCVLLIISSLRGYDVGGDLANYIPLFKEIASFSPYNNIFIYDKYGFIFKFYIYICSFISSHPSFFLFCLSFITLSLIFYFIRKTSKDYGLSIFLFIIFGFYTNTFNSLRSSLALSIATIGVLEIMQNKRGWAFLLFLIAFEIHKTILPIFILLFFREYHLSLTKILMLISGSLLLSIAVGISGLAYLIMIYDSTYGRAVDFEGGGYVLLAMDIVITIGCFFLLKNNKDLKSQLLLFLMVIATCIQTIAPVFSLATRISYFFLFYVIILIPNIIVAKFKSINYKIIYTCTIIIGLFYFKVTTMSISPETHTNSQHTIPYYFFWEQKPKL